MQKPTDKPSTGAPNPAKRLPPTSQEAMIGEGEEEQGRGRAFRGVGGGAHCCDARTPFSLPICRGGGARRGGRARRRAKKIQETKATAGCLAACLSVCLSVCPPAYPQRLPPPNKKTTSSHDRPTDPTRLDRPERGARGGRAGRRRVGSRNKGETGGGEEREGEGDPPYLQRFKSDKAGHGKSINDVLFGRRGLSAFPPRGSGPGRGGGRGLPIVFLVGTRRRGERGCPGPAGSGATGRTGPS